MMRSILQYVYKNLLPATIRHSIDLFGSLRMSNFDGLNERKVLVLAPHPDDDIIACGGTMCRYHHQGAKITVVYMTDGRKGNIDRKGIKRYEEDELSRIRREEAKRAAEVVGVDRLIFLDNHDGELALNAKSSSEMSRVLEDVKPEAVFVPFFLDAHEDHMATCRVFFSAIDASSHSCGCYCYGVWAPLPFFNVYSDITPYVDLKVRALKEHGSQLEFSDLCRASKGLSEYYAVMAMRDGYMEVFLGCSSNEFKRLGAAVGW